MSFGEMFSGALTQVQKNLTVRSLFFLTNHFVDFFKGFHELQYTLNDFFLLFFLVIWPNLFVSSSLNTMVVYQSAVNESWNK